MAGASLPEHKQHTILFKTEGVGGGAGAELGRGWGRAGEGRAGCHALWRWREKVPGTRAGPRLTLIPGHLGSLSVAKPTHFLLSPDKGIQILGPRINNNKKQKASRPQNQDLRTTRKRTSTAQLALGSALRSHNDLGQETQHANGPTQWSTLCSLLPNPDHVLPGLRVPTHSAINCGQGQVW